MDGKMSRKVEKWMGKCLEQWKNGWENVQKSGKMDGNMSRKVKKWMGTCLEK